MLVPRTIDCECLNTREHNHEECVDNVAHCSNSESDKPSSCFVLWATDNVTGKGFFSMAHTMAIETNVFFFQANILLR